MTRLECEAHGPSHYRLQVHRDLYLDAEDPDHFEGRFINDARNSKFKVNARFAANYTTETDSITGRTWVRIYATRKIKAGEEIFLNYGKAFSTGIKRNKPTPRTPISSNNSDMWAAPAYIPEDSTITLTTPNSNNHSSPTILTPSPHSNHMIMGHQYPNYTHVLTSPLRQPHYHLYIRTHT